MTEVEIQFSEYLDALVVIEIAVAMAHREKRPINKTIRDCWAVVRLRMNNKNNMAIFDGLSKQVFPDGALKMLRRHLRDVAGGEVVMCDVVDAINA